MINTKRRVVITGIGPVTSIGIGKQAFWDGLAHGKKAYDKITRFDPEAIGLKTNFASEIKNFSATDFVTAKEADRMDRFSQFAVAAALMAFEDANLTMQKIDPDRMGVVIGTAVGGVESLSDSTETIREHGIKKISPAIIPKILSSLVASQISMMLKAHGPNKVLSNACVSATHALGDAMIMIRHGYADIAIAGGSEACITPWGFIGFGAAKALSTRNNDPMSASRPFDKERDGFVMGEGAGILVLEEYEHALRRGANIYAELCGYGATADAFHVTAPLADGSKSAKAMVLAMHDGGLSPADINYVNAHGTSTIYNDLYETKAIKLALGEHSYKTPISSTKSMIGHTQGASGAIGVIATLLCMLNNTVHPTVNLDNPDPECDLDYVPNKARRHIINAALCNALGFGGNNGCLALKKIVQK